MGFTNKTLVIIDVGINDDTGMATLYLEIVRELKRDIFTQLHVSSFFHYLVESVGKDRRQKCLIFFCLKCLMLCLFCAQIHSQSPTIQSPTIQL